MENIESNKYSDLVDVFMSFTSDDNSRLYANNPFTKGETTFATDSVSLIYTHRDNLPGLFATEKYDLSAERYIRDPNSNIHVPVADLNPFKTEVEYSTVDKRAECKTCDGTGDVEWEFEGYTKDDDCPECKGKGVIGEFLKKPTGEMTFGAMMYVKIKGVLFHASQIHRLFETAKKLKSDVYLTHVPDKLDAFTFQIGVVNVVVMSCFSTGEEEVILNIK